MRYTVSTTEELIQAVQASRQETERTEIYLKENTYHVTSPLVLGSHTALYGKKGTVLSGAATLPVGKTDRNGIVTIDVSGVLPDQGYAFPLGPYRDYWDIGMPKPYMESFGPVFELFWHGRRMPLSRYPEKGDMTIAKIANPPDGMRGNDPFSKIGSFIPSDTGFFDREDARNMLLVGYYGLDWAIQRHKVASYDKTTKVLTVEEPYHLFGYRENHGLFHVLNTKQGLRNPGDWYLDFDARTVSFIPYPGQTEVGITVQTDMLSANEAEDIVLDGLEIAECRRSAVRMSNVKDVQITNCALHDLGAWGAVIENGSFCTVADCHVHDTGAGGIAVSGGDRPELISSHDTITRCDIHDVAYWHRTYAAGVDIRGVNITVSDNYLHDLLHMAVTYHGNDHIIEKNDITRVCTESNDVGAIYAGRDYTCGGTVIRYNYLHDIRGRDGNGCRGIYFDDGVCTAEVYGNMLADIHIMAIQLGGGRNYDIHDNIFYRCTHAVHFDARLDTWESRNRILLGTMQAVPCNSPLWLKKYPYLDGLLDDEPTLPKYNRFHHNTVIGGEIFFACPDRYRSYLEIDDNTFLPLGAPKS